MDVEIQCIALVNMQVAESPAVSKILQTILHAGDFVACLPFLRLLCGIIGCTCLFLAYNAPFPHAGDYVAAILSKQRAETLSSVLYPDDRTYEGKELRLKQQHFFVSATIQQQHFCVSASSGEMVPAHGDRACTRWGCRTPAPIQVRVPAQLPSVTGAQGTIHQSNCDCGLDCASLKKGRSSPASSWSLQTVGALWLQHLNRRPQRQDFNMVAPEGATYGWRRAVSAGGCVHCVGAPEGVAMDQGTMSV
eukprot:1008301-Pelagomonas_calceolata.AAC.10